MHLTHVERIAAIRLKAPLARAYQNGLLLLSCGLSTVRFMPPLMVDIPTIDEALNLLEISLIEALASSRAH